jgi:hypothetical protein
MPVIGIKIDKIEAKRNEEVKATGPIRVAPSQRMIDVKENQINSPSGKIKAIDIGFEFSIIYDPAVGEIKMIGTVLFQDTAKARKEILKTWKDSQRLLKSIEQEVIANLTSRAFLIAINCAREIGIPSPMPFKFRQE